jgi:transcription elongation GreA/GreB family factor
MARNILTRQEYIELQQSMDDLNKKYKEIIKEGYQSGAEQDGHHDEGFQLSKGTSEVYLRQINSLRSLLRDADIIEPEEQDATVRLGNGVIARYSDGTILKFVMSGYIGESLEFKISVYSELGRLLLGKKKGSVIKIKLPDGPERIVIEKIFLPSKINDMLTD